MSKYIVTDLVTNDVYPAEDPYEVGEAVYYLAGPDLTYSEETELLEVLSDVNLWEQGYDFGTVVYPTLNISIRSTQ